MKSRRTALHRSPQTIRKAACLCLVWLLVTACQAAFGDFEFDLSKLAVSCQTGSARCKDNTIQVCSNGNEWLDGDTCQPPDQCNLTQRNCAPCRPGSYQCNGAQPQRCDDLKRWVPATTQPCESAALCKLADDALNASCTPAGCKTAGELQCVKDRLQRCPVSLVGWEDIESCASEALCNVDEAKRQIAEGGFPTCVVPICSPGQYNCDTGSPRPCKVDRTGWGEALTTCSGTSCNVAKGDCSSCTTGTYACSGANLSQCMGGQTWSSISSCNSVLSCNSAAETPACDPQVCTPGEWRCNDLNTLERCRSDGGKWEFVEQCVTQALCNPKDTRCAVPACPDGAKRCQGNEYQACAGDFTHWDLISTCQPMETCDPVKGCLGQACSEGTYRCNDVALEQCVQSTWTRKEPCKTTGLCDAARQQCIPPACAPGQRQCVGSTVQRCKSDQSGFADLETCPKKSVCSQETKRCEPG